MKTVVITGISRGIGKALAEKFLSERYFVIGSSTTGHVDFSHPNLVVVVLDLRQEQSISSCVAEISHLGKKIHCLINNAGVLVDEDETAVKIDLLRQTLEVNLIGTVAFTEGLIPLMDDKGHIISLSSSAGSISRTGHLGAHFAGYYPAYKISKAALNMYMRTLALRLHDGIIVSAVHPGWVKTTMGGEEADITSEESAEDIYHFAISQPESGQFWHKSKKFPW